MSEEQKYDIVLYGATGFTGRLATQYLADNYGTTIKWAIAGRSKSKLEDLARDLGRNLCSIIIADSTDEPSLIAMCKSTKVVATTAGPFARYGTPVVKACVETGCDYCDITGETQWVRDMIALHDDAAAASGSRIVHLCGHDSIPWDLSTMMLAKKLKESGEEMTNIDFYDDIKSAPSGGTLETAFGIMFGKEKNMRKSAAQKSLGFDPLLKSQKTESKSTIVAQNVGLLKFSSTPRTLPHRSLFFMAGVNAYAVKRSNALLNYGKKITYCEGQAFNSRFSAITHIVSLMLLGIALYFPPTRYILRKFVLPKPGEGPSLESMKAGHLHVLGVAKGSNGTTVQSTMSFHVDPGYLDTSRMLVESALSFSLGKGVTCDGGVFTPGCCQGEVLLERLMKSGTGFEYHESLPKSRLA